MPLHITKIAFGCDSAETLRRWLESHEPFGEAIITTRYLPKRHEEMAGGSLYWIHAHTLVGRSPILGFAETGDGRWAVRLAPRLIAVRPTPRRAHQGWRYLDGADAPPDLGGDGDAGGEPLPASLVAELAKLGLA